MRFTLKKEITFVLFAKVLGLTFLWWVCFSHPTAKTLHTEQIWQHFLSSPQNSVETC